MSSSKQRRQLDQGTLAYTVLPAFLPVFCLLIIFSKKWKLLQATMTEGGFIEVGSAIFWLLISVLALLHAKRLKSEKAVSYFYILLALGSLIFFFEEISWGQRIFKLKTPTFLKNINYQQETNLHNIELKLGSEKSIKINKFASSFVIAPFLVIYFIFLPVAYEYKNPRLKRIRTLVEKFRLPLIPIRQIWPLALFLILNYVVLANFFEKINFERFREAEITEFYVPYLFFLLLGRQYQRLSNIKY